MRILMVFVTVASWWAGAGSFALEPPAATAQGWARLSPFQDLRLAGGRVEVELDGARYELVSILGRSTAEILAHCRRTYGERWEKRLAEDLVEVLAGLGLGRRTEVDLVLIELSSGARVELRGVAMTAEKRRELMERRRSSSVPPTVDPGAVRRVERVHRSEPSAAHAELARIRPPLDGERLLTRAQAQEDLDELEWRIVNEFAYRDLAGVDVPAVFDAVRAGLGERVGRGAFAEALQRLIARFGDGHAGLHGGWAELDSSRSVPCLFVAAGEAVLALRPDRGGFLDPDRPRLLALDGVPIEGWIAAARPYVPDGSGQLVRERVLGKLRSIELLRRELGLPAAESLSLELARPEGTDSVRRALPLTSERPLYGEWPRTRTALLAGDIGYLRLARMEEGSDFLDGLDRAMDAFRHTAGLVIDVRGNGGGSRLPLLRLFPYFMGPDEGPHVASVAALRLGGGAAALPEGLLADRFSWPLSASRWGDEEREAIGRAAARFRPSWTPPAGEFSPWHWLVLARSDNPRAYSYGAPVVLLMDTGCFSATDIFLGAFAGRPGVTLLGVPSGGGSGRARSAPLAHSGLGVRLSTMISFRPDGAPYDGRGVAPDVLVEAPPEWHVGGRDPQLEAALALLAARRSDVPQGSGR